ncbi:MAG: acyl-CoA thioesterase [Alphaproteobacteria bacterium]
MSDAPCPADFPLRHPFRVRYAETDAQGVVFFGNYLIYFDTAISEYFRALGYDYANQVRETGTDFHVVRASVEYFAPLRYDDEIEVGVRIARLGTASLTFEVAIFVEGSEEPASTGEITWVNADQSTGKSAPAPESLRRLIAEKDPQSLAGN